MQRTLFSLLLSSTLATSVYAVTDPTVMAIDADGNYRYSEHDICKTADVVSPKVTFSADAMTFTVSRDGVTEETVAVTENVTEIYFGNYLNGIGDNATDYQTPVKDKTGQYLIQNAGNLAYIVTKLGDSTAPADGNYLQIKDIDATAIEATLDKNATAFTGTLTQETEGQTISGLKLSTASANPLSNGTGTVTATLTDATISLNGTATKTIAIISTTDSKHQYFVAANLIDLTDLNDQVPSDATEVYFMPFTESEKSTYTRKSTYIKKYISVCLPFDLKADEVPGEAWTYKGYETSNGNITKVKFAKVDTSNGLAANTPVIIKTDTQDTDWTVDITERPITLEDKAISEIDGIYGSLNEHRIYGNYLKVDSTGEILLPIYDTDKGGGHNYPFRTCIYVGGGTIPATVACVFDEESGIDHIDGDTEDAIIDVYTLQGTLVAKSVKSSEAASQLEDGVYVTSKGDKLIVK